MSTRRDRIQKLLRRPRQKVIVVRITSFGDGPTPPPILIGGTEEERDAVRARLAAEAEQAAPGAEETGA